jgi:hypothetical protein
MFDTDRVQATDSAYMIYYFASARILLEMFYIDGTNVASHFLMLSFAAHIYKFNVLAALNRGFDRKLPGLVVE